MEMEKWRCSNGKQSHGIILITNQLYLDTKQDDEHTTHTKQLLTPL